MSESGETEPLQSVDGSALLEALGRLNEIGASINHISSADTAGLAGVLSLIVESAVKTVPGASAVLYTYDARRSSFDALSRVSAGEGEWAGPIGPAHLSEDAPRPNGMGIRAVRQRRAILSYEERNLSIHPAKAAAGAQAVVCVPLVAAEQPEGALYVYLREDRRFTRLELLLLSNLVNQAAIALYHARQVDSIQRDLSRKEDELALLRNAGLLISSRTRVEETLEAILQMALEVTGARYGIFRLVDRTGENLLTRAIAGDRLGHPAIEALPINTTSVMGWVAKTRQPLNIPDVTLPPWSRIYYPLDHSLDMRSELAVPLVGSSGRLEGVLNLESPQPHAFSEADSHLLQSLSSQAVIAIQEVRLLDALRDTAERLLTQPVGQVLDHLAELACDLLNTDGSGIWTLEREELSLRAARAADQRNTLPRLSEEHIRRALQTGTALTYDRLGAAAGRNTSGWTSGLVAPVLTGPGERAIGAFAVYSMADRAEFNPSEWDKKILGILAHYAALALENETHQRALSEAQAARAVAETFAAMGDVAANLLHHLNNKVGTIPVRIEGIQDKCAQALEENPYLATNLEEIERAALDAMAAVRERLSLLRPIDTAPTALADCTADARDQTRLPEEIEIETTGLESLPPVMAGRETLTLAIANLLQNASEAMDGRGRISISGEAGPGWVELCVSDDGPGVALEDHASIFDLSFSRGALSGSRSERSSRLGFGLWWVKTLMARLGGSVGVESDGRSGATFRLRLPAAADGGRQR